MQQKKRLPLSQVALEFKLKQSMKFSCMCVCVYVCITKFIVGIHKFLFIRRTMLYATCLEIATSNNCTCEKVKSLRTQRKWPAVRRSGNVFVKSEYLFNILIRIYCPICRFCRNNCQVFLGLLADNIVTLLTL